jgi:hypothetical protein
MERNLQEMRWQVERKAHLETLYRQADAARAARLACPRRARWWRLVWAGWRITLLVEPERQVAR